jgi:uncharacterized membrane protein YphA (DoxX/SURF4 family)
MKTATLIARILLGVIFLVFGLNGFLHFLPMPPMPQAAGAFFGALAATGYMVPLIFGWQVIGGTLLLVGFVPLALLILAPVIVNIVAFHLYLAPDGLGLGLLVAALETFLAWACRGTFRPLFTSDVATVARTVRREGLDPNVLGKTTHGIESSHNRQY